MVRSPVPGGSIKLYGGRGVARFEAEMHRRSFSEVLKRISSAPVWLQESDIVMESSSDSLQRSGQEPMTTLCKDAEPEDCPVAPRSVVREGDVRALPSEAWSKIHSSFLHSEPNTLMTASAQPACHSAASIGDFRILPRSAWVRLHAPFQTT